MQKFISVNELSNYLGVKTSTIYGWVYKKRIPFTRLEGRILFQETQIESFIEQNSFIPRKRILNSPSQRFRKQTNKNSKYGEPVM